MGIFRVPAMTQDAKAQDWRALTSTRSLPKRDGHWLMGEASANQQSPRARARTRAHLRIIVVAAASTDVTWKFRYQETTLQTFHGLSKLLSARACGESLLQLCF